MGATKPQCFVRDKVGLLRAIRKELVGNGSISFEGDLRRLALTNLPGASHEESAALKRNTRWPKQDFIVARLEPTSIKPMLSAIAGALPRTMIHVQVERQGIREFRAYDHSHPESFLGVPAALGYLSRSSLRAY
ncbi:MAG TPA: hypothetical protein VGP19_03615 [Candidatus Acidoferrales bacterium]|jgi:hypothetical protein|nr:hypothetical protein [Candidatus Acidoferrales bacterium]